MHAYRSSLSLEPIMFEYLLLDTRVVTPIAIANLSNTHFSHACTLGDTVPGMLATASGPYTANTIKIVDAATIQEGLGCFMFFTDSFAILINLNVLLISMRYRY